METGSLFLTIVLACMTSTLLVGAAVYFFCRFRERRSSGTSRAETVGETSAPVPAPPRAQTPVMKAVPAQTYVPPEETPQAETAVQTSPPETTPSTATTEEKTLRAEIEAEVTVVAPETEEAETVTPEEAAPESAEAEAPAAKTTHTRIYPSPEPFFREYMGPGKLVPIRISERTRTENDDAFVWL